LVICDNGVLGSQYQIGSFIRNPSVSDSWMVVCSPAKSLLNLMVIVSLLMLVMIPSSGKVSCLIVLPMSFSRWSVMVM